MREARKKVFQRMGWWFLGCLFLYSVAYGLERGFVGGPPLSFVGQMFLVPALALHLLSGMAFKAVDGGPALMNMANTNPPRFFFIGAVLSLVAQATALLVVGLL